ncbi:MAG TPA: polyketide cyclase, partial [Anaeromyxobacteraceae bacterium]|nr:polyketide cyclase [Anaeromyxobacteraceae bacterium]
WAMAGKLGFVGKAMCLVKDMDQMIGPDFEKGLAALKGVAESEARKAAAAATAVPAAVAAPAK